MNTLTTKILGAVLALASLVALPAGANESVRLTDTIKKGVGAINLLKDLTPAQLETLRTLSGGKLIFGVDINEAANGSEKSTTQGVAIKDIRLSLSFKDGSTKSYNLAEGCCSTKTQALVAEKGSSTRKLWYTLLGETGSSRITNANKIQSVFDDTLTITAPDDLSGLTAAVLNVSLLATDDSKGDPEGFYDFSGGFEDLALLNPTDAKFLDELRPGRDGAPGIIKKEPKEVEEDDDDDGDDHHDSETPAPALEVEKWNYLPSAETYYMVAYEDLFPKNGDYDYNDLVVAYQVRYGMNKENKVVAISGAAYILARGAAFSHDFHLRIPIPANVTSTLECNRIGIKPAYNGVCSATDPVQASGTVDMTLFPDTLNIFPDPMGWSVFINVFSGRQLVAGPRSTFSLKLNTPVDATALGAAPFDPYLFVRNTGKTIQLLQVNAAMKDPNGYPGAMLMPSDKWLWPYEKTAITVAYPNFATFVSSQGSQATNWYNTSVPEKVFTRLPATSVWAW